MPAGVLRFCLSSVKQQSRVLNTLSGPGCKHQVGVQGSAPACEESTLYLRILCEPGFTNTFAGQSELLKSCGKRILATSGMLLLEELAACQTSASNGMAEGLWLRLCRWRSSEGSLGLGGRGRGSEELYLFAYSTAKVVEGLISDQIENRTKQIGFISPL